MPDTKPTTPDVSKAKAEIARGQAHPTADPLVRTLYQMLLVHPTAPQTVLQWLAEQSIDVVRIAILRAQTAPYAIAVEPLVDSLSDDQARGVLMAIMNGVYQGRATTK
jgi:hypothetical protein